MDPVQATADETVSEVCGASDNIEERTGMLDRQGSETGPGNYPNLP